MKLSLPPDLDPTVKGPAPAGDNDKRMSQKIIVKHAAVHGRRVNATPESDIPEEVAAEQKANKAKASAKKRSRVLCIIAAVFLWLPFLYPIVFFVHGALRGYPVPVIMYPYLVLYAIMLSDIGGLLLYLASRAADTLRKPIGWTELAQFLLPIIANILLGNALYRFDYTAISAPRVMVVFVCLILALLCMIALCVFSVLLLKRVYKKELPPE